MRAAIIIASALALAGCEQIAAWRNPAIKACRAQLLDRLKSPASYKEVKVETHSAPLSRADYARLHDRLGMNHEALLPEAPAIYSVIITYDADNSFGALLRDTELCQFTAYRVDEAPDANRVKAAVDMMKYRIDPATGEQEPCCLTAFAEKP